MATVLDLECSMDSSTNNVVFRSAKGDKIAVWFLDECYTTNFGLPVQYSFPASGRVGPACLTVS
jgi:hypothetical protein